MQGDGRQTTYEQDVAMEPITVRLTLWHVRAARRHGSGNVSEGIRKAIEAMCDEKPHWSSIPKPTKRQ